ncbi:MAG TPA: FlgO family outer membrane protein [Stellaceae bacterium]|nr:FlgO family outer membrane protein [Stellaceae bacterium]
MRSLFALLVLFAAGISGCAPLPPVPPPVPLTLTPQAALAVDRLMAGLPHHPPSTTVLVASAADLHSPKLLHTSTFGRLLTEHLAGRLTQEGYRVPEIRLSHAMIATDGGEFILSNRLKDIARFNDGQFVLASTYAGIGPLYYVNLELVRLYDRAVVRTASFETRRIGDF